MSVSCSGLLAYLELHRLYRFAQRDELGLIAREPTDEDVSIATHDGKFDVAQADEDPGLNQVSVRL